MLFGADDQGVPWWWLAIVGVGGPVATWLSGRVAAWINGNRQYEREVKREALDEAYKLIDRLQVDLSKSDEKVDKLAVKCNRMEVKYERAIAWIEYVQDHLKRVSPPVYVRAWKDPDDTGGHRPLSSEVSSGQ